MTSTERRLLQVMADNKGWCSRGFLRQRSRLLRVQRALDRLVARSLIRSEEHETYEIIYRITGDGLKAIGRNW